MTRRKRITSLRSEAAQWTAYSESARQRAAAMLVEADRLERQESEDVESPNAVEWYFREYLPQLRRAH